MSETAAYNEGELIVFPIARTNIGGHYNPDRSVFICPYQGTYVFYVNVKATTDGPSMGVDIMVNDVLYGVALADNVSAAYNTASNMAVVACEPGYVVWIQCNENT